MDARGRTGRTRHPSLTYDSDARARLSCHMSYARNLRLSVNFVHNIHGKRVPLYIVTQHHCRGLKLADIKCWHIRGIYEAYHIL